MEIDKIIGRIVGLENDLIVSSGGKVELAPAHVLSETSVKMTLLLANLSEPLFQAELAYKQDRAKKFDDMLKSGEKRTAVETYIRFDKELIRKELEVERIRNFIKRIDMLVSAMKAHIQVKTQESRNQGM